MTDADLTPLMRQYREIKRAYREAILFFRVGDFYEMFYEDAEEASRLLSIALTSRDKSSTDAVPLCGVPHHAASGYIAKLLKAGRTVALCDQVEDPKLAKGLVRREVVRLYTPGTLIDTELLAAGESNYLAAVACPTSSRSEPDRSPTLGLAALEVSTGQFWVLESCGDRAVDELYDELCRLDPREVLYPEPTPESLRTTLSRLTTARLCARDPDIFDHSEAARLLQEHFGVASLDGFGCRGLSAGVAAAGAVLRYLRDTQPAAGLGHVRRLQVRQAGIEMHLDHHTIRNLELLRPLNEGPPGTRTVTLLEVLDRTVTVMGSRLLRDWIVRPLLEVSQIRARLAAVHELVARLDHRVGIRGALREVQDIARLSSRISLGVANPRDLLALKRSLDALPALRKHLVELQGDLLHDMAGRWDDLSDVRDLIDRTILPDAPVSVRDGNIIRDGWDPRLDELRTAVRDGRDWIARLEVDQRAATGIESLKVRFNQVFGYYIEVTKANLAKVPVQYLRKQTLANAERFTTPELKELEARVTGATVKLTALEQELFEQVRRRLAEETPRIQGMAGLLAALDVLAGLAEAAALNGYTQPEVSDSGIIEISGGRHPVVERLDLQGGFIPNDTRLDRDRQRVHIITGPNMAGKSTYLRQVALIVLLAQMGSFVPARAARIGLVDRIFTRVGASDNLASGLSTFMVEMTETAQILNCASSRSLILLDEIGRGTSTYDGLSIAWAVAEYIQDRDRLGARTLFATHYHEMTELEGLREGVLNYTVLVQERDEDVLFLRKIVRGRADRSYGIHVAQLAGLPPEVITRANAVLTQLESSSSASPVRSTDPDPQPDSNESGPTRLSSSQAEQGRGVLNPAVCLPRPHPILEEVRQMDLFSMSPLDALNRLAELQRRLAPPRREADDPEAIPPSADRDRTRPSELT